MPKLPFLFAAPYLALALQTEAIIDGVGKTAVLVVEIIAEDLEEVPCGILRKGIEHLNAPTKGDRGLLTANPSPINAWVTPNNPRGLAILLREENFHDVIADFEGRGLSWINLNDSGVEVVLSKILVTLQNPCSQPVAIL